MTKARRLLVAIGLVAAGAAYLVLVGLQPAYRNPVLDNDAPDPSVVRTADGTYYAYTTQAYFGAQFVNVPILHSSDLLSWELAGDAFPDEPGMGSAVAGRHVGTAHGGVGRRQLSPLLLRVAT